MNLYSVLRSDDSSESSEVETLVEGNALTQKSGRASATSLGPWTLAVCVLCTAINLGVTIWSPPSFAIAPRSLSSLTANEARLLRRPNQFIGLEKVSRPSPPQPTTFTNYPIVILPVDSADPRKVFDHEPKRHSSQVGTITPEDRRVVVTDTLSTFVQFRAIDFGMEMCELNIKLPALSKLPFTPPSSALALYRVETEYALDTSSLSYATRSPRLPKLADIPFHDTEDIHWHRTFACPSESVLTFELACSTSTGHNCNVEWWQDKVPELTEADAAVFVTQHATI